MVNSHFDGSQNQRLLQREMERLHTDSSAHLDDALSALTFSFASPEMVRTLVRHIGQYASRPQLQIYKDNCSCLPVAHASAGQGSSAHHSSVQH